MLTHHTEEVLAKSHAKALYDSGALAALTPGSTAALRAIHVALFEGIYADAGELRDVAIAKGGYSFVPPQYIEVSMQNVEKMPQSTFEEIIAKYVQMNMIHPFREGNGRSMRIWLDELLKAEIGKVVDWTAVEKEDYLLAMERSPIRDIELRYVLGQALTEQSHDRDLFLQGLDQSFFFEGFYAVNAREAH
ncbi:protein adenylyltransferase Fic [Alloscardovia macacae]|uniref:protein adenylyltransferase n=1 Tax=Alloscardovia macacae TaxID=1160091 RepID=A0A261F260_9BIFI|nr:Fic family protein [Alloscardovia macacae]OZG53207.1 fic family protein [Alloscardovia macacae]